MRTLALLVALPSVALAEDVDGDGVEDPGDEEVIEVSGKAPEEAKPLAYELSAKDIATTPGAMNDALRAITILPAAARIPFSFGGVVLRGMSPRDSSVFIDGVEIPLAYHFGGITGVVPTQALESMRVVPSGFDVSLGRTQGGVVELTTRKPRRDAYRIGGEVSLLHSLVSAEGPLGSGGFLVTLRRSYFDVLARPLVSAEDPLPSYTDGVLRAVWGEPGKQGQLATYLIASLDRIANDTTAVNLGFVRTGASYKRQLGNTRWTIAPMFGTNILTLYDKTENEFEPARELDITRGWYLFGGRGEWLRDDAHGFTRVGIDVEGGYLGRIQQPASGTDEDELPLPRNTVLWTNAAAFVETLRQWDGNRFSIRPGLRVERFGLGNDWAIDPRVTGHATLSPISTMRASFGRFHQPPSPAHFDEFADNLNAKSSYVDQATLAVEVAPQAGLLATITTFFHEGKHTLVDIADKNVRQTDLGLALTLRELLEEQIGLYGYQANVGRQRTYGLETSVRYDGAKVRALANFVWSRSKRQYEPALGGGFVPYGLDQPLRLNLLATTTAYRWNFGARLTIASGNPIPIIPEGTVDDPMVDEDELRITDRLPTFWQLDVRVSRTWPKAWGAITFFMDIQNITNHRNVEYRDSYPDEDGVYRYEDVLGLPIIPYIGVEFAPR